MFLVPGFIERWHDRDQRFRRLFDLEYRRMLDDDAARNGELPVESRFWVAGVRDAFERS